MSTIRVVKALETVSSSRITVSWLKDIDIVVTFTCLTRSSWRSRTSPEVILTSITSLAYIARQTSTDRILGLRMEVTSVCMRHPTSWNSWTWTRTTWDIDFNEWVTIESSFTDFTGRTTCIVSASKTDTRF